MSSPPFKDLLTSDVPNGTGTIKSASDAPTLSPSATENALLSQINARPSTPMDGVLLASLDTLLTTEDNASLPQFKDLLILDVLNGTGTTKSASDAQSTGLPSMESAPQFLLNALHGTLKEPALLAIKATTFKTEPALLPQFKDLLILDVESGTGTAKSACHALRDSSSTHKDHALPSLLSVHHGITTVSAPTVTKDTTFKTEDASLHPFNPQLILDVDNGTGITKPALNAHSVILMDPMDSALLSHLSAPHGTLTVPALLALSDTH